MQYKYQLEKYTGLKSKFTCPSCDEKQSFTKYIDIESNEYLSDDVGICNRLVKCGYHKSPKGYFSEHNMPNHNVKTHHKPVQKVNILDTIPVDKLEKSITSKKTNNFVAFLYENFEKQKVYNVINLYKIGTNNYWKGATVFWQIDNKNRIRTGKIMLYSSETGKRIKEPHSHINWYHSLYKKKLNLKEYNLQQCLFGEHILNERECNNIAIVESEKTAIICSIYFPNIVWLASGGLTNITKNKLECVLNKNVTLYPDNGAFDKWKEKADMLNFNTSSLMEEKGSGGQDIADLLLLHNKTLKTIN